MKKRLLNLIMAVVAMMGCWGSVLAQESGNYYLRNTTTNTFLARGASWGTEAVTDAYGVPFSWDPAVGLIEFLDWKGVYLNGTEAIYTDQGSCAWKFSPTDGGYYMQNASTDGYVTQKTGDWGYYLSVTPSRDEAVVWEFVTIEEHDAIVNGYPTNNINNVINAAGLTDVTAETFETELASGKWDAIDMTSSVGTAKFAGNRGDWTYTEVRAQGGQPAYGTNFCEMWQAIGWHEQTITGLDEGIYKVTVQGFHRYGGWSACNTDAANGLQLSSAYLQANNDQVRLKSWFSEKSGEKNPNNTGEIVSAFNAGKYVNTVYTYVGEEGTLKLKVAVTGWKGDAWLAFNNVTLTRYTKMDLTELETKLSDLRSEVQTYIGINSAIDEEVNSAHANTENVDEDPIALADAINELTTVIEHASALKPVIEKAKVAITTCENILENSTATDKEEFSTVVETAKATIDASIDENAIYSATETLETARQAYVITCYPTNGITFDMTHLMNMETEVTNWGGGEAVVTIENIKVVEHYEEQPITGDILWQTTSNLPDGVYNVELFCNSNACEWNFSSTLTYDENGIAQEENLTNLYANNVVVPVPVHRLKNDGKCETYVLENVVVYGGELTVKLVNENISANWQTIANKSLTLVRALNDEEIAEGEKEQAAAKLAAAKELLYTAGNKVATLNAIINDEAVATILTEAQAMYENEAVTLDEVTVKTAEVYNALNSYANDALLNGSFETSTEGAIDNWTQVKEGEYAHSGIAAYGSETLVNSASAPATNIIGGEGTALGISAAWKSKMSFTQDVTLPAGKYILSYEAYNSNPTASLATNLTGVSVGETSFNSSLTSYEGLAWTNDAIEFELTEESAVTVTLGYISNNIGSSTTPKLWIDNVAIYLVEAYAPAKVPSSLEPANGSEVGMLTKIEAKFDFEIEKNWDATEMPVVKNSNGETVYTLESYHATMNDTWDGFVFTMPEAIMTPDTYTITVPAGLINEVDAEGNPTGETNDAFEVTYVVTGEFAPVAEDFVPTACDPEDGATINQLYSFNLTFAEAPQVNYEVENPVTVYNEDGDVISTGSVFGSRMPNAVTVACNNMGESITAGGTYTVVVAAGAIGNELWLNTGGVTGSCNPEMTYTFTVVEPDLNPTAIVPDNNSEVEKIESITLTYEFAVGLNWSVEEKITVKDAEGNVVAEADGDACEEIRPEGANFWDPCYTIKVNFATPVTANGTYTVNIPAEFLLMGEAGEFKSKATELTYTVDAGNVPTNLNPANGSEVGMLTKFEAKFDFEIEKNWDATEMPVVKNSNGETVYTLESYHATMNDTWDGFVFTMPEAIMTPDTYTITVPAGLINEVDAEGNPTGETNDAFEVTYVVTGEFAPVAEDFVPTACDPEDGATINQLYSFNLTFAEAPQVNYEVENPVTVYNEDGDVISTGSVFGSRMPNAVTVACNNMGESITAGGTYTVVVAAGAIGNELWLNTGGVTGSCNPEMTYTFTVVEPDLNPTAIVPDNNSEVEKIESITLTYEFAVGLNWSVEEKITVKDAEGNVVAEADGDACEEIRPEGANFWDPCYTIKVNFATPVIAKGTYTVNIPAEFLFMGEAGEFKSKATELTYTVNGGQNISNIFAEDGNVTVYTVNGVKVMDNQPVSELKNLKKGIYIINGKTMVIK